MHYAYDGLHPTPGLRRKLVVPVKNPTLIPIPPPQKKMIPTLSWQTPTLSFRVLCGCSVHGTRNERVGIIFLLWGIGISVGFFTETTSFLRNPGVRRSPSYLLYGDASYKAKNPKLQKHLHHAPSSSKKQRPVIKN